jgi:hypothetical protein
MVQLFRGKGSNVVLRFLGPTVRVSKRKPLAGKFPEPAPTPWVRTDRQAIIYCKGDLSRTVSLLFPVP